MEISLIQLFIILLVAFITAYFIGLTITSVVDNRLRDTTINMPRPKIEVKIDSDLLYKQLLKENQEKGINLQQLEGFTNPEPKETSKATPKGDDSKAYLEKLKQHVKDLEQKVKTIKPKDTQLPLSKYPRIRENKPAQEHFMGPPLTTYWDNPVYTIENPVRKERALEYPPQELDKNVSAYGKNYMNNNERVREQIENPKYKPFNEETVAQDFQPIDYKGNREREKKVKNFKPINFVEQKVSNADFRRNWNELPPREDRCPDFRCQRMWDNCTDNHHPRVPIM
jgi:FtsZ-interacting cell division protein ZipA